jgi:hypothetical protein
MTVTADAVIGQEEVAQQPGAGVEVVAKKSGLGAFSKKIGQFVNKLMGKKQKAMKEEKVTKEEKAAAAPAPEPAAEEPAVVPVPVAPVPVAA